MLKVVTLAVLLGAVAQPAIAMDNSEGAVAPEASAKKAKDPNRLICEREDTTGTRLGSRKVCLTAAQWQEKRREHREELERAQKNVGIKNEG